MSNFPNPPAPPKSDRQVLQQLADYYRQLVAYHSQAANDAAITLSQLEVLLELQGTWSVETDKPEIELVEDKGEELERSRSQSAGEIEISQTKDFEPTVSQIAEILETNRGKMLHLDFLVRKLYGWLESENLKSAQTITKKLLEFGVAEGKWFAVPDSPNCWTIDLNEFPEFQQSPPTTQKLGLSTTETSKLLGITVNSLLSIRSRYSEKFKLGVHYQADSRKHYFWTEKGIAQLRSLSKKPQNNSQNQTVSGKLATLGEIDFVSPYQGLSTKEALLELLKANKGKFLKIQEILRLLYGDINSSSANIVYSRVSKALQAGKKQQLWNSTRELGYTINLSANLV